jgi:Zn-dependent metalloprotease
MTTHGTIHCILPPYLLDHMAHSADPEVRRLAIDAIGLSAAARATRSTMAAMPAMSAIPSPERKKHRLVYDAAHAEWPGLPGKLVRSEGGAKVEDPSVNEAYDYAGATYDFYKRVFGRNSLDDDGMALLSSVHFGIRYDNAFWNGEQMVYGDGDGQIFTRFTKSLDVVGHELSHGVVTNTCNLVYHGESGALNEHFADVFGTLVKQWKRKQTVTTASWLIGQEIMGPKTAAAAIRTFEDKKAYEDDPVLGTDPQPKRLRDKYTGPDDSGGVHINSGIPNHAFYLVAKTLGGHAWERAGAVWYAAVKALGPRSVFLDMVRQTESSAIALYGNGSKERKAVAAAWKAVGF